MENQASPHQVWLPIIGRALAQIALQMSPARDKATAEKAQFLEALGLNRKDAAELLGTSYASVTELLRQARKKGGKRRG